LFDIGDIVPLTVEIRDATGTLANAGSGVVLTLGLPDGTTLLPSVTNPSTGRYQVDYIPTLPGRHTTRWVASGTNASAFSGTFDVRPIDPGYIISLPETKQFLNIPDINTSDDEEIRGYLEAVTTVIENWRNEKMVRQTVIERHDVRRTHQLTIRTGPLISVTEIKRVDGSFTWDVAQLDVDTARGTVSTVTGFPEFYGFIKVTVVVGYSVIPANFSLAAKIIVGHLWATQRQPAIGGSVFSSGETDSTPSGFGFSIPNRAAELLGDRPPVIA
jgi:hypothetical protein